MILYDVIIIIILINDHSIEVMVSLSALSSSEGLLLFHCECHHIGNYVSRDFAVHSSIHWFIPIFLQCLFKSITTQMRSQLQHWYCVGVNTPQRYRQLRVKDLPMVSTWRLEWDLNLQPSGRKAPNLPLSHQAPLINCSLKRSQCCSINLVNHYKFLNS